MSTTRLFALFRVAVLVALVTVACTPTGAPATNAPANTQAPGNTQAPPTTAAPQQITFQAGFLPQGNISFVAVYVAKEKGFFDEVGLDVSVEHAGPGTGEHYQRLAAKQIQFATSPAETHVNQVAGTETPFKSVALFGHQGDHAIMYYDDGTLSDLSDMRGKTLGFKGDVSPWVRAMLTAAGLTENDVQMIPVGFDPRVILPDFGEGRVDAVTVFKSNEPDTMTRNGFPIGVWRPEDYGVAFLGQTYVTHVDYIRDDPEMVRKFVRATMRALDYILDPANANEITDIVMTYAGADADRAHQEFLWQTEASYVTAASTEAVGLGYATDEEWSTMIDIMVEYEALTEAVPVDLVWDPQFVESIYENGQLVWP